MQARFLFCVVISLYSLTGKEKKKDSFRWQVEKEAKPLRNHEAHLHYHRINFPSHRVLVLAEPA